MTTLLNDDETYEKIDHNPFESLQTRTKLLLKEVNVECDRNLSVFQLSLSDTSLARAYGLPKIHKKDVPLRPIISLVGSQRMFSPRFFTKNCHLSSNHQLPTSTTASTSRVRSPTFQFQQIMCSSH
ncbi:unnamed protein product [Trichogramma brassicae]|uniref:Uncharacterized protein n=1 Tax=Trichogramma brassicae TaxID=86971 RepID=A0A6H5I0W7_9HYME|nr:unnamed protein product [Trichogramma brassicae]